MSDRSNGHHLTYPSSGRAPEDTRWFYLTEVKPDHKAQSLLKRIEYCEQMAERARQGSKPGSFVKFNPDSVRAFEQAAEEARRAYAELLAMGDAA